MGSISRSTSPDLPESSSKGKRNKSFIVLILRANLSLERGNLFDNQENHKSTFKE